MFRTFLSHLNSDPVSKILKKHKDFQSAKVARNRSVFLTLYLREPSQLSVTHFKGTKGILLKKTKNIIILDLRSKNTGFRIYFNIIIALAAIYLL